MNRLSNLLYVLLGAVAVGAVVAVLAVTGALPDKVERTTVTPTTTADAEQNTNEDQDPQRKRALGVTIVDGRLNLLLVH